MVHEMTNVLSKTENRLSLKTPQNSFSFSIPRCNGPDHVVGDNGCKSCQIGRKRADGSTECISPETESCGVGYFLSYSKPEAKISSYKVIFTSNRNINKQAAVVKIFVLWRWYFYSYK